ncbi:MAG: hypothetical protein COZ49_01770 [Candidatus Yonathbacteria bacterium CG_4_10_14_3_um_filter_47_65]|uniref:Methyltransferase type 11 domain-containing protein n=2 Tax=Parcubacteria group TaxID=1794811 RepID=A0A2M8DA90_9BACT|nr:MAG: hypothetical protein AUJ44_00560 [Candidatus Nomurabacteria bacterium CG1_02_47_685]PIP04264.1 MAG: hypothetical protein COX54_00045 [Candidatus Yonathbacteria bacterium CG23_combo_of_CG06-09_8_20_14_all_46_18]PIQ31161.1 MAG: hypothetical protein COW61_04330 [Candidatus Yonathbacteria bacterium CG17_big_fil_post_rev_8_21_14_2_50_46_19]PIX56505.1 MAG: hypothetical protein COZ49_01770 [Candidatus Yonathbacteria bacterium CG_4_10_14_3_um_filter_47_65]PIY57910.1 MAG: hypothetical protein CO
MPKADWEENTIKNIFSRADLWPWKDDEIVSILDVACGLSLKSKFLPAKIRVGVDIHEKYFDHIESDVPYVVIKHDVRKLNEIFVSKSFDIVIGLDIVEHLEKEESLNMIKQCEEIARKAVIFECPKGFIPQNIDIQGHDADHWQTHRSAWEPEEFEKLGFKTLIRDYTMSNVKRHTEIDDIDVHVQMIDAIKFMEKKQR